MAVAKWSDIVASEKYQQLSAEGKQQLKTRYWDKVVVPSEQYQALDDGKRTDLYRKMFGTDPGAAKAEEAKPAESRSVLDAAGDVALSGLGMATMTAQGLVDTPKFAGLAANWGMKKLGIRDQKEYENAAAAIEDAYSGIDDRFARTNKAIKEAKSTQQQAQLNAIEKAAQGDDWGAVLTALKNNPAGVADIAAQSLGDTLIGGIAGKATFARKLAQLTEKVGPEAAKKIAMRAAVLSGASVEAVQSAAHASSGQAENIAQLDDAKLAGQSARFRELLEGGVDSKTARQILAAEADLASGAFTGAGTAIGGLAFMPVQKIVPILNGEVGRAAADTFALGGINRAKAVVQGVGKTALAEAGQETTQSAAEAVGGNVAAQQTYNNQQGLGQGVVGQALVGGAAGAVVGGGMHIAGNVGGIADRKAPAGLAGETTEDLQRALLTLAGDNDPLAAQERSRILAELQTRQASTPGLGGIADRAQTHAAATAPAAPASDATVIGYILEQEQAGELPTARELSEKFGIEIPRARELQQAVVSSRSSRSQGAGINRTAAAGPQAGLNFEQPQQPAPEQAAATPPAATSAEEKARGGVTRTVTMQIGGKDPKKVSYRHAPDGRLFREIEYADGEKSKTFLVTEGSPDGDEMWVAVDQYNDGKKSLWPVQVKADDVDGIIDQDAIDLGARESTPAAPEVPPQAPPAAAEAPKAGGEKAAAPASENVPPGVVPAHFRTEEEKQSAIAELRAQGVEEDAPAFLDVLHGIVDPAEVERRMPKAPSSQRREATEEERAKQGQATSAWRDWLRRNRTRASDELFIGGHEDARNYNSLPDDVRGRSAHGMSKGGAAALEQLRDLLRNGVDTNRRGGLDVAPLSGGAQTGQTSSGNAYTDGAFTLVAREGVGRITDINQVEAVVVNSTLPDEILSGLRQEFPAMKFVRSNELSSLSSNSQAAKKEKTAAPAATDVNGEQGDYINPDALEKIIAEDEGGQPPPDGGDRRQEQRRHDNAPVTEEHRQGGRRVDDATLWDKPADQMDVETLRAVVDGVRVAAQTSYLTGLGNMRAWAAVRKKRYIASIDADALKWVNDNMDHAAGDKMLAEVGKALKDAGLEAYHVSGDEYWAHADSEEELRAGLEKARAAIGGVKLESDKWTLTGLSFSYGVAEDEKAAEEGMHHEKASREAAGLRPERGGVPAGAQRRGETGKAVQGEDGGNHPDSAGRGESGQGAREPVKPETVQVPAAINAALDKELEKAKGRMTRARNEAGKQDTKDGRVSSLEKEKVAERMLQRMRANRFNAEDLALKAIEAKDPAVFTGDVAELFPGVRAELDAMFPDAGQHDDLQDDPEMRGYEQRAPHNGDPKNSPDQDELGGFKVGDRVNVEGRTIGLSEITALWARNLAGGAINVASVRSVETGKELAQVNLSSLSKAEEKKEAGPSKQFLNYEKWIKEGNIVSAGMRETIETDERLNDGEAARLLAMAGGKTTGSNSDQGPQVIFAHVGDKGTKVTATIPPKPEKSGEVTSENARRGEYRLRIGRNEVASVLEAADRGEFMVRVGGESYGSFRMSESGEISHVKARSQWAQDAVKDAASQFAIEHGANGKPARSDYGADNKLVTKDRAAELREKLKKKLNGGQFNSGIDPEILAMGAELAVFHIEAGARRFSDFSKAIAGDLGATVSGIRQYLRSWYNGARDMMEDAGLDVSGMDTADTVRDELAKIPPAGVEAAAGRADTGNEQAPQEREQEQINEREQVRVDGAEALDEVASEEGSFPEGSGGLELDGADGSQADGRAGGRADGARVPSARSGRDSAPRKGASKAGGRRRAGTVGEGRNGQDGEVGQVEIGGELFSAPNIPAANFQITEDVGLGKGGEVQKFNDNLAAIRTLKRIESENRRASPEEQSVLARYVGWGGLANAFPDPVSGEFKEKWKSRGEELRDLLTPSEYSAARRSTRNAHYTSETIVSAIWKAVERLGFKGGLVLESSMGTGNFVGLAPKIPNAKFIGVEYDSLTARIAQALYPQATVLHSGFQSVPIADNSFALNIGNPPFGSESLRFQFKTELSGVSIHNQFFRAGMDALRPGGIQAMVVSRFLMDAQDKSSRIALARQAKLIAAIRLPDTAFKENARTEVVTDILIFQKMTTEEQARMKPILDALEAPSAKDARMEAERRATAAQAPSWIGVTKMADPLGGDAMTVNTYFQENPGNIIGVLERSGSMQHGADITVRLDDTASLGKRLDRIIADLPENVQDFDAEVLSATEGRHKSMSDALRIALNNEEAGHLKIDSDGKLQRVIERETPEGGFEYAMQEITEDSPFSDRLTMDDKGRWYTLDVATDADGKPVKQVNAKGEATKRNVVTRTIYASEADIPASLLLGKAGYAKLRAIVKLRDLLKKQIVLETEDAPSAAMEANRKALAGAYKAFTDEYGPVNRSANLRLAMTMPDGGLVSALEVSYQPERTAAQAAKTGLEQQKEIAKQAPILSARAIPKYEPATSAATPADALAITLSESGAVKIDRIADLLGVSNEEAVARLQEGEEPLVFQDPETNQWETADAYLSGMVKRKLVAAREANLPLNIKALEKVQPEPWTAEKVTPVLGSNWIPTDIYEAFVTHLMGGSTRVSYSRLTNSYNITNEGGRDTEEWSSSGASTDYIIGRMLNSQPVVVRVEDGEGNNRIDPELTQLAGLKAKEIYGEFADWVFKDSDRRARLVEIFNEQFNTRVLRQPNGQHIMLPGKTPTIEMRRHQKNAIWRGIYSRFMLVDHAVGAGKTFTAIARAMERRRMGLSRKPMIVVPNHLIEQWEADVYRLYPGAKVLAAGKKDFEAKNRRKLFAKIATGDWDIVIVPHSSFLFIGISPETEQRYLQAEMAAAQAAIVEAWKAAEEEGNGNGRKPFGVKEAERLAEKIQARMDRLSGAARDRLLTFEQLGVDDLTVDEAHEFKNLYYSSRLANVSGMGNKTGVRKASDLYNKIRTIRETPTGSVTFLTGTPISNSAAEMFTMLRYLAADQVSEMGLEHFDSFRSMYVDVDSRFEPTEAGNLKEVVRLGRTWSNMRSLMDLYYSVTDAVSLDDIKKWYAADNGGEEFPVPKIAGGKDRNLISIKPTEAQVEVLESVLKGFDSLDYIKDPFERNKARLRLMNVARSIALDVRSISPSRLAEAGIENAGKYASSPEKGGKIQIASENIKRIYDKFSDVRGTQIVFCDRSVPSAKSDGKVLKEYDALIERRRNAISMGDEADLQAVLEALEKYDANEIEELRAAQAGGWNAYKQLKENLVAMGVPDKEIAFVQDADNDEKKTALFEAVNGGKVRVLIGSTPRMGAGTNVQQRLVALHHIDVTWKPSDIEQREGRIIRQGNLFATKPTADKPNPLYRPNFEVEVIAYATERSNDSKMWDLNATKLRTINGIRKYDGEFTMEFEDEESTGMKEMAAIISGNPLLLERVTLESQIATLELKERAHRRKMWMVQDQLDSARKSIRDYPDMISRLKERAKEVKESLASINERHGNRTVTVEGVEFGNLVDAYKAVQESVALQQAGNEKARYSVMVNGEPVTSRDAIDSAILGSLGDASPFEAKIGEETFYTRSKAYSAITKALNKAVADVPVGRKNVVQLGSYMGFTLEAIVGVGELTGISVDLTVKGKSGRIATTRPSSPEIGKPISSQAVRAAMDEANHDIASAASDTHANYYERALASAQKSLPELEGKTGEQFKGAEELAEKRDRLRAVISELMASAPSKTKDAEPDSGNESQETPAFRQGRADSVGMPKRAAQRVLNETDANVRAVQSFDDLPDAIKAEAVKQGISPGDVKGVHWKGQSLLVADNVSETEVRRVAFHEGMHGRLRAAYGREVIAKMVDLAGRLSGTGKPSERVVAMAQAQGIDLTAYIRGLNKDGTKTNREKLAVLTEELLAHLEEGRATVWGELKAYLQAVVGAIRAFLRKHGFKQFADLGVTDLQHLLRQARLHGESVSHAGGDPVFHAVWHGSPHDFDRFSLEHIGSGEGAQAYGWGLYFAGKREIGEHYRKVLSARKHGDQFIIGGKRYETIAAAKNDGVFTGAEIEMIDDAELQDSISSLGVRDGLMSFYEAATKYGGDKDVARSIVGKITPDDSAAGRLYRVEIPKDDKFLLWDKPLSEQPKAVKKALGKLSVPAKAIEALHNNKPSMVSGGKSDGFGGIEGGEIKNGQALYILLSEGGYGHMRGIGGSPEEASRYLHSLGIAGIKYLDGSSRGTGEGSYNYVVFDDNAIRIVDKHAPAFSARNTESAAFRRWFGDSKVVDAQGKPLVVYHGTNADVSMFDRDMRGSATDAPSAKLGFFFASSHGVASSYAQTSNPYNDGGLIGAINKITLGWYERFNEALLLREKGKGLLPSGGGNVMPVYLSLQNPMVIDQGGNEYREETYYDIIRRAQAGGHDGVIIRNTFDEGYEDYGNEKTDVYVAFRPEQIKSAIGNNGEFDPANPDIRFSLRAQANAAQASTVSNLRAGIRNWLASRQQSDRTFNRFWHTTVGTQFHKATLNRHFKAVYDIGQAYLSGVARNAADAMDAAPTVLGRMENVKDWKRDLSSVFTASADSADMKAVAKPIFTGTLRDGKIYSSEELRDEFGLTPKQIELYFEIRSAIRVSLNSLARAEIYDRMKTMEVLSPMVLAAMRSMDTEIETYENFVIAALEQARQELKDQLDAAQDDDEKENIKRALGKIRSAKSNVRAVTRRLNKLMLEGYAPLMRFGEHTVTVRNDEGETVHFSMHETQAEANRAKEQLRSVVPENHTVESGIMAQSEHELFQGVTPETLALFADSAGVSKDELYQEYLKRAVSNRSALKRLIHRKETPGFDRDIQRVLAAFVTSNARRAAKLEHLGHLDEAIDAIPQRNGDVKTEALKFRKYMLDTGGEAQKFRSLLFTYYIAGSIASAAVNLTQPITMTFPYLSRWGGKRAAAELARATKDAAVSFGASEFVPEDVADAYQSAKRDGVVDPQNIFNMMAMAEGRLTAESPASRGLKALNHALALLFSQAEALNRKSAFIAAFRIGRTLTRAELQAAGVRTPYEFAVRAVTETQGVYNRGNRPDWARGPVGATVFTFKQFVISYVEFLRRLWKNDKVAFLIAIGILQALAGLLGQPFAKDVEDAVGTALGWAGFGVNPETKLRQTAKDLLGEDAGEFMLYGSSALLPIDVHGRLGMGDIIPATNVASPYVTPQQKQRELLQIVGVTGGLADTALSAATSVGQGRLGEGMSNAVPTFAKNFLKGAEMVTTGEYRDSHGRKVADATVGEGIGKMLGFQPSSIARESRELSSQMAQVNIQRTKEDYFADTIAQAVATGDKDGIKAAFEDVRKWNEKNPDLKVKIDREQIARRVKEMRSTRLERFERQVPKEIKGSVLH